MARVTTEIIKITPEIALDWLTSNTHNRPIRDRWVDELIARIKRGEWHLNGETIKFSTEKVLLDGQHRLLAIYKSGLTCEALVTRELSPEAYETIDTGKSRTVGDFFAVNKEEHSQVLANAVRYLWLLQSPRENWQVRLTNSQASNVLANAPNLRQSLTIGLACRKLMPSGLVAALHYLFSTIDPERAREFFDRVASGIDLHPGDPVLQLRERLIERNKGYNVRPIMQGALTIKAWNAYHIGTRLANLRWRQTGPTPELFPEIEGLDLRKQARMLAKKNASEASRKGAMTKRRAIEAQQGTC